MSGSLRWVLVVVAVVAVLGAAFVLMDDGTDGERGAAAPLRGAGEAQRSARGAAPQPLEVGQTAQPTSLAPPSTAPAAGARASGTADADDGDAEPPRAQLELRGRVLDPEGRPVPGTRVVYHGGDALLIAGVSRFTGEAAPEDPASETDAEGRFAFAVPVPREDPAGAEIRLDRRARLALVADGFAVGIHECPPLAEPGVDLGDLYLAYGTALFGVAVDETGRAVAGAVARVRTHAEPGAPGRDMFAVFTGGSLAQRYTRATTDAAGRFQVAHLPAGTHTLELEADGMQSAYLEDVETRVGAPRDVGVITLEAGAAIAGYVTDRRGEPVEGATVRVSSLARLVLADEATGGPPRLGREWQLRATTDGAGRFELVGLAPGQYTVHARADGYAPAEQPNVATGKRDVHLELERLGGAFVRLRSARDDGLLSDAQLVPGPRPFERGGRVVQRQGRLRDVELLEGAEALAAAGHDAADEDPAGAYFLSGIGPDGALVKVLAEGHAAHEFEIQGLADGARSEHSVTLVPEAVIAGVVLDGNGDPLPDARVSAEAWEPPAEQGDAVFLSRDVSLAFGDDGEGPRDWTTTRSDEQGRFRFANVPPGDWQLKASSPAAAPGEAQLVSVAEGEEHKGVVLRLELAGSIRGRVVEEDGTPIARGRITARLLEDRRPAGGSPADALREQLTAQVSAQLGLDGGERRDTVADERGEFELQGLTPGRWEVALEEQRGVVMGGGAAFVLLDGLDNPAAEDTAQVVQVAAEEESFVEIVRPPRAVLEGRVTAAGEPVPGARVKLVERSDSPFALNLGGGESVEAGPDGRYRFEDVAAGSYSVSALVPGAAMRLSRDVELEGGRTSRQDLAFAGATLRGRVVDADTGAGVEGAKITATPVVADGGGGIDFGGMRIVTSFEVDDGGGPSGGGFDMTLGGGSTSTVRTDADGRFEVRFLEPGDYTLQSEGGGYAGGEIGPLEVGDDRTLDDVIIEVQRAGAIHGTVLDGSTGLPLDGVPVSVGLVGSGPGNGELVMTENGAYRVEGLDPGQYAVSVLGSGFGADALATENVNLGAGEDLLVDLTTKP